MKILQVTAFLSPALGGSAEIPYQLSKKLAEKGHQVTLYTSDYRLDRGYLDSLNGVAVFPFKTWSSVASFYMTPALIRRAAWEVKQFDVVHLHNFRTFQNVIIHHYAKKYGIPYVLQAHGSLPRIVAREALKLFYDKLWGNVSLKDASKLIAITGTEAGQYRKKGVPGDKIAVVPHDINLTEYTNLPEKGVFRYKYGLNDSQRIILWLGRINKIKGLDLLVKAFSNIIDSLTDVRLVIAGPDDGYLTRIKSVIANLNISDRVMFTGPLYKTAKLEAYVDADIFVLPSVYEVFGITVLEALACGTTVVVTDNCGIADAVNGGQAGIVIPHDEQQLQKAIISILNEDELRVKYGNNGISLVREKFSQGKMAQRMEQIYQSVARS